MAQAEHIEAEARVHGIAGAYLEAYAEDLAIVDLDLAATISMHVALHFAPLMAIEPAGSERQELFIAEIVRMLTAWISRDSLSQSNRGE